MSDQSLVAIGDIHGCPRSLAAMLEQLEPYNNRKMVFVGDYIDRGPDSKAVVDLLLDYNRDHDCIFLRGNHEQMLLDSISEGEMSLWLMNGGRTTIDSYGGSDGTGFSLPEEHLKFYENTQMYYETANYFFVHAGLSPARTIADSINDEEQVFEFLWERSHLSAYETAWEKTVVFGHTPRQNPLKRDSMIGIDTGCVYSSRGLGTLTSVLLPEEKFIQQTCLD